MQRIHWVAVTSLAFWTIFTTTGVSSAAFTPIPNPDFRQGDATPSGWTLSGGKGRWLDRHILEVTGDGNDNNDWRCRYRYTPGGLYRLQFRSRGAGNGVVTGPTFANHDYCVTDAWRWYSHVFRVPENAGYDCLRLGQWHRSGITQFDAVRLTPVMPVHKTIGSFQLGDGESIHGGRYTFAGSFGHDGGGFHRPLLRGTPYFNTDRWCFGGKSEVIYRFGLQGHPFRTATVQFTIGYYARGGCVAEISRDQKTWQSLVVRNSTGHAEGKVPADLLPADVLYVRLRCATNDSSFQVGSVDFSADVDGTPPEGDGRTEYADIDDAIRGLVVVNAHCDDSQGPQRPTIQLTVKNAGSVAMPITFSADAAIHTENKDAAAATTSPNQTMAAVNLAPGKSHVFTAAVPLDRCGRHDIRLSLVGANGKAATLTLPWTISEYYRSDFGRRIEGVAGDTEVWCCDAAWKISRQRPSPKATSTAATFSAAKNDHEAVQIVVRPSKDMKQLTAVADAFVGPDGATIPASNIQILREYYHFVHAPTDRTGVRDWWPDALPPLNAPLDLPAGQNQPLWLLTYVPKDAPAGDYVGAIHLKAAGWATTVPVKLHVWNFALPKQNHLETAFGLSFANPLRYQQIKTDDAKRRVIDMYLQSFADHRISPYNPTPSARIGVKFLPKANPPRAELDFKAFDIAMTAALEKYHFTNFMVPIEGMGGGTFESRAEGKIANFGEHTPEYQAMFSSYLKQLESHLREKGWLKMAYTYWFDEPEPKDYAFVQAGMDKLKKYAPDLQTMITKHELQADWKGRIDIWCPLTPEFKSDVADRRRARGERYWWYVCCGPKEPFCTLFIDHPATDLRVWLWQTWQRKINGILVWESAWWTSRPEPAQNPYDDPMGYVDGSAPNEKKYWGNGDGRFLYPPLAAAKPGISGSAPIIEPPVTSIRWEMLREGVEDYEFLWLLRDLIAKHRTTISAEQAKRYESLLDVPESITSGITTFTTDPSPIYARRTAIAEAIEQLSK